MREKSTCPWARAYSGRMRERVEYDIGSAIRNL